jgi:hypothetical protein
MKNKLTILSLLNLVAAACLQPQCIIANSNYINLNQNPPAKSTKLMQKIQSLQLQLTTYESRSLRLTASQSAASPTQAVQFKIIYHSPIAITSVIISGLCFLTASLLIYVK